MKQLFVSYAHKDHDLVEKVLNGLKDHLGSHTSLQFDLWKDNERLLTGQNWDQEIRKALAAADFGLFFVSPAFRCSHYIQTVEFQGLQDRAIVVGTRQVCFKTQLDPALAAMQIYRHRTPRRGELVFSQCRTAQDREDFVFGLYQQILGRV
jgi:hypothetical protein